MSAMDRLEPNEQTVTSFYDLLFNQSKPAEAIERLAGDEYIQHNPLVADGKRAFIKYFEPMAREYPGKRVELKRMVAEENFHQKWPDGSDWAGIDILRVNDQGKIVEHWEGSPGSSGHECERQHDVLEAVVSEAKYSGE